MKKIRIGKDIVLRWTILTNGEAIPLDGRNLKLFIIDCIGNKTEMDFTVSGNIQGNRAKKNWDIPTDIVGELSAGKSVCCRLLRCLPIGGFNM